MITKKNILDLCNKLRLSNNSSSVETLKSVSLNYCVYGKEKILSLEIMNNGNVFYQPLKMPRQAANLKVIETIKANVVQFDNACSMLFGKTNHNPLSIVYNFCRYELGYISGAMKQFNV